MHTRSAISSMPRRSKRLASALAAAALIVVFGFAVAQEPVDEPVGAAVRVYYFWGDGCPICVQQKSYLEWLELRHPDIEVHAFEVWYVRDHLTLLEAFSDAFDQPVRGVPVTFIGDRAWVGFNQLAAEQMTAAVDDYALLDVPPDAGERVEQELLARFLTEAP